MFHQFLIELRFCSHIRVTGFHAICNLLDWQVYFYTHMAEFFLKWKASLAYKVFQMLILVCCYRYNVIIAPNYSHNLESHHSSTHHLPHWEPTVLSSTRLWSTWPNHPSPRSCSTSVSLGLTSLRTSSTCPCGTTRSTLASCGQTPNAEQVLGFSSVRSFSKIKNLNKASF